MSALWAHVLPNQANSMEGDKSEDMDCLNSLFQRWMPSQQRVAVDSNPRLHGIFDTINASPGTSSPTIQLPRGIYDTKALDMIDRIAVEEEYSGFKTSHEYRVLGIGGLLAEVIGRMGETVKQCSDRLLEAGRSVSLSKYSARFGMTKDHIESRRLKMAFFGCHDATFAAILTSLGAMEGENSRWPPFSSSLAIELLEQRQVSEKMKGRSTNVLHQIEDTTRFSSESEVSLSPNLDNGARDIHLWLFVRLRYNERPIIVQACRPSGRHRDGDETFCTLV